jgi:hypothetical protein
MIASQSPEMPKSALRRNMRDGIIGSEFSIVSSTLLLWWIRRNSRELRHFFV